MRKVVTSTSPTTAALSPRMSSGAAGPKVLPDALGCGHLNEMQTILWILVSVVGAVAWGVLALHRGELPGIDPALASVPRVIEPTLDALRRALE